MLLSNVPVRNQADLKGKKVWLPEGDLVSYEAMKALQVSPVSQRYTRAEGSSQSGSSSTSTVTV